MVPLTTYQLVRTHPVILVGNGSRLSGGVFPAAPGFGSMKLAQQTNTGLGFVGGRVSGVLESPSYHALFSNYTLLQQGLTADVTCSEISLQAVSPPQNATVPVGIFNASVTYLNAYAYSMTCDQGEATLYLVVIVVETRNSKETRHNKTT